MLYHSWRIECFDQLKDCLFSCVTILKELISQDKGKSVTKISSNVLNYIIFFPYTCIILYPTSFYCGTRSPNSFIAITHFYSYFHYSLLLLIFWSDKIDIFGHYSLKEALLIFLKICLISKLK